MVKNLPGNTGEVGLIPWSERSPGEGNGDPSPVFLPEKSHGYRSPLGHMGVGHDLVTEQQKHQECVSPNMVDFVFNHMCQLLNQ